MISQTKSDTKSADRPEFTIIRRFSKPVGVTARIKGAARYSESLDLTGNVFAVGEQLCG